MEESDTSPQRPSTSKKRKTPTKKEPKSTFTIDLEKEQPDKLAPLVGYFPSGFGPNPDGPIQLHRNKRKIRRLQLTVNPSPNGSSSELRCVGTNFTGEATSGRMCSYALGIIDRKTNNFKVVPIAANKVFRLHPRVRASGASDKEPSSQDQAEITQLDRYDKLNDLTDKYGTSGARKKAKQRAVLKGKEDEDGDLKEVIDETAIDKKALAATGAETSRNIPPHDESADTPEKAYPLEQIILRGEWDYLLDIWELVQAGQELKPDSHPTYVRNRVYKLETIKDEGEKMKLAGILSYITQLVKFKDQNSLDGFSCAKHHKIPSMLFQKFTRMFTDMEKRRLSDEKSGLLISYVLVLTLFVDDFQTDLIDIAKDLKMSPSSLRSYYEHLGCQFKRRNNTTVAILSVPLKFPILKRRKRG